MRFSNQLDDGLQKRMTGEHEFCNRLHVHQFLVEANSFVPPLHRLARLRMHPAIADIKRNVGDFPSSGLPFLDSSAQILERSDKKALDMARLKPLRFRFHHLAPELPHSGSGQSVVRERIGFNNFFDTSSVCNGIDSIDLAGCRFGFAAVSDRIE